MNEIVEKSARELRALIGSKALSPVEVFDAFKARIEQANPAVNAIVASDFARGRAEAERAEATVMRGDTLGLLHGLPIGIKDLQLTEGLRTTFGSLVYKDHVPAVDELLVARIRRAGGIVIGKTNTPEFGSGANTINRVYGATVNPFALDLSAAGSSGGSAAALATDMVALATGSDLGGSLRTPASFCGVVGHRPSPGACPTDQAGDAWSPLAVEGPMARDVGDAALLMAAMVGSTPDDPLSQALSATPFAALPEVDPHRLKVAFTTDFGSIPVSAEVRRCFESVARTIAPLFAETSWQHPDVGDLDTTFETLRAVGYAQSLGDYVRDHRRLASPNVIANVELARTLSLMDVGRAHGAQTQLFRNFRDLFQDIDILVCPAAAVFPFPVERVYVEEVDSIRMASYIRWVAIAYAVTLSSHPVTVIPAGLGSMGLPFGVQIVGRHNDDVGTLAAAAAIEAQLARDPTLARPRPDIGSLTKPGAGGWAGRVPPALEAHA